MTLGGDAMDLAQHEAALETLRRDHVGAHRISCDTIRHLEVEIERLRAALEIIAGRRQCLDNLMSHADVARAALEAVP